MTATRGVEELALALAHWLEHQRDAHGQPYVPWEIPRAAYFQVDGDAPEESPALESELRLAADTASVVLPVVADVASARSRPSPEIVPPLHSAQSSRLIPEPAVSQLAPVHVASDQIAPPEKREQLKVAAQDWSNEKKLSYLHQKVIGDCQRCPLASSRRNLVFGVGNPEASVMVVGEAPGAQEDAQGEPFVGVAGQRLNRWLAAAGLRREDVFIANVLKCRPPGNRDPAPLEIERCSGFLRAQIRAVAPRVILALGRFAGTLLVERPNTTLGKMRGVEHAYVDPRSDGRKIPVFVTFHASYVLRCEKEPGPAKAVAAASRPSEDEIAVHDVQRAVSRAREG